jgi:hypothetical protein
MRPTQLNYRNPTEKTSEFKTSNINYKGEIVDFNFQKLNKLITINPNIDSQNT